MEKFTYKSVTPDHAAAWRDLRIAGARDFPLGFLITPDEAEQASLSRCRDILKNGLTVRERGESVQDDLMGDHQALVEEVTERPSLRNRPRTHTYYNQHQTEKT